MKLLNVFHQNEHHQEGQENELTPEVLSDSHQVDDEQNSPAKPTQKFKTLLGIITAAGAIALAGFGYHWWQYASTHEETDDATVIGDIHPISARISDTVQQVLVRDNQLVKKGQILVKLDPRDYQIRLQQAQTQLEAALRQANTAKINIALSSQTASASHTQAQGDVNNAKAAIASAQAQVIQAQEAIPQAKAQLAEAEANLQKAQLDYNRFTQLYQQGAIAKRDFDAASQTYNVALAQKQAAVQGVEQAQAKLLQVQQAVTSAKADFQSSQGDLQSAAAKSMATQVSRSEYATSEVQIAQAKVALNNAKLQLSYTNITAPTDGRIGNKSVEVGQQVQPGQNLIALVSPQNWVVANFKETQLNHIRPGEQAEVKLDAFPNKTFIGTVDSISPASGADFALLPPDNATGNFTKIVQRIPVKIVFNQESIQGYESLITPGMSATVTVNLQ
ncbi:HlyD family secretion protein [Nostoc sp. FACHB-152]|uniref:HlyD family secretion protein n=1 Tax=unclassified Nostoc TaxID=2593658 RepID=UPI001686FBA5|nr:MULTISPECIES: HlyD family secretion protein [unclassified Nostoc]MBD2451948.1 HlyD family secretion protein [Nostoc sp. FACHB-152]MBD2473040.1 HlyD family secretion protein [Nostoc sp. FACHB-145]